MPHVETTDGTRIFYKDWGQGRPILFAHGWPLSADAWDAQTMWFVSRGYRVIAHDRRGHGRSDQPSDGNDMDTYADDLAAVIDKLDLRDLVMVGHSTGGGEVAHYIGRHGTGRVAKAALIGAVPPIMIRTEANPDGLPIAVFDGIRSGLTADRAQLYRDLADGPFFGANRPGAKVSQGARDDFWRMSMMGGLKGHHDCVHEFSEVDYTPDLERFDVPTLILHGDDDQIVPIGCAAMRSSKIVRDAKLVIYEGAPHGLTVTLAERFNTDLLAFIEE